MSTCCHFVSCGLPESQCKGVERYGTVTYHGCVFFLSFSYTWGGPSEEEHVREYDRLWAIRYADLGPTWSEVTPQQWFNQPIWVADRNNVPFGPDAFDERGRPTARERMERNRPYQVEDIAEWAGLDLAAGVSAEHIRLRRSISQATGRLPYGDILDAFERIQMPRSAAAIYDVLRSNEAYYDVLRSPGAAQQWSNGMYPGFESLPHLVNWAANVVDAPAKRNSLQGSNLVYWGIWQRQLEAGGPMYAFSYVVGGPESAMADGAAVPDEWLEGLATYGIKAGPGGTFDIYMADGGAWHIIADLSPDDVRSATGSFLGDRPEPGTIAELKPAGVSPWLLAAVAFAAYKYL